MSRYEFPAKPLANVKAVVGGEGKKFRFTVLAEGLLRYEYAADGVFEDRASVFAVNREQPVPGFRVVDQEDNLEIDTKYFHLYYDKQEFSSTGLKVQVKGGATVSNSLWRYNFRHEEELFKLKGTARTLDRANGRIPLGDGVINENGYAEVDDSGSMLFTQDGWIAARRPPKDGPRIDGYLFAYGLDYKGAVKALYAVSGAQPLLPRWAFGNWWSRWYAYTSDDYLELMDTFRDRGIPLSVCVLDMDWHWVYEEKVRAAGVSGWTGYSWNTKLIPKPRDFLREMHSRGLRVPACDHPADGVQPYEDAYEDVCKATGRDPATKDPVPFDITDRKYVDAYCDIVLKRLEDDGLDFFWQDWQQGEVSPLPGVDPIQPLNHFHFHNMKRRDHSRRPFIFSRFAGPGSHRYPVGFSGDSVITWDSLDFQPEFTATASNIGFGYWSNDIGGHMFGYRDDELATRWVQLGVFSPINRLHSTNNPWMSKEPWSYPAEACAAQTAALRLRHQLVPYLYSMAVRATRDAEPLVQPLYWSYPTRQEAYANKRQFSFGSELLVNPLTSARDQSTHRSQIDAWLPPGKYVDVFNGIIYDGDRNVALHRKLDEYAVLARAGSIIPLAAPVDTNKAQFATPLPADLTVKIVAGADASFELVEDDGSGDSLDTVNFVTTRMSLSVKQKRFTIAAAQGTHRHTVIPHRRNWTLEFVALDWRCKPVALLNESDYKTVTSTTTSGSTIVKVADVPTSDTLEIRFGQALRLGVNDVKRLAFERIHEAQMSYEPKKVLWNAVAPARREKHGREAGVDAAASWATRIGQVIGAKDVPEGVRGSVLEVLLADERAIGVSSSST